MAALNQEKDRTILFLLTVSAASFPIKINIWSLKMLSLKPRWGQSKQMLLDIVNGKLHIGEIYLEEPENGQTIKII